MLIDYGNWMEVLAMADEDNGSQTQQTTGSDTPPTHGTKTVWGNEDKNTNGKK